LKISKIGLKLKNKYGIIKAWKIKAQLRHSLPRACIFYLYSADFSALSPANVDSFIFSYFFGKFQKKN